MHLFIISYIYYVGSTQFTSFYQSTNLYQQIIHIVYDFQNNTIFYYFVITLYHMLLMMLSMLFPICQWYIAQ